jgi:multisubunit Na+/H+ antiporter MnhC subunit
MDKFMAWVAYTLTTLIIGVAIIGLFIHVFADISRLYEVSLVIALPFSELVGYVLLARMLIFVKGTDKKKLKELINGEDKTSSAQSFGYSLLNALVMTLLILGTWASAYLVHWFIL